MNSNLMSMNEFGTPPSESEPSESRPHVAELQGWRVRQDERRNSITGVPLGKNTNEAIAGAVAEMLGWEDFTTGLRGVIEQYNRPTIKNVAGALMSLTDAVRGLLTNQMTVSGDSPYQTIPSPIVGFVSHMLTHVEGSQGVAPVKDMALLWGALREVQADPSNSINPKLVRDIKSYAQQAFYNRVEFVVKEHIIKNNLPYEFYDCDDSINFLGLFGTISRECYEALCMKPRDFERMESAVGSWMSAYLMRALIQDDPDANQRYESVAAKCAAIVTEIAARYEDVIPAIIKLNARDDEGPFRGMPNDVTTFNNFFSQDKLNEALAAFAQEVSLKCPVSSQ